MYLISLQEARKRFDKACLQYDQVCFLMIYSIFLAKNDNCGVISFFDNLARNATLGMLN